MHNDKPLYKQLRDLIAGQIRDGLILEDSMIPSIRQLSISEQVNPITVSKAYQSLVEEGIIEKQRGLGMRVIIGAQKKLLNDERHYFLKTEWPAIKKRLLTLNISLEDLLHD